MKMLTKNIENRNQVEIVNLEEMVPANHLLRQIDAAIDFNKIYEFVGELYCEDNGRPSIDPIVLFEIVLIQHIYGIRSLRRTLEEVSMNMAYRWFIGYPLNEQVPHFSTVSYNFKHRFNTASVEYIFRWVLKAAVDEVIRAAQTTVLELQQTTVDGWKQANSDGKLTKEEITELSKLLLEGTMAKKMSDASKKLLNAAGVDISAIITDAGESLIAQIKKA